MRISKQLKAFIISEIKENARNMGIKPSALPDVALEIIPKTSLGKGGQQSAIKMFGVFFEESGSQRVADMLFLNVGAHPNRKALRHTIIHELVHLKHPGWKHGKKFNDLVEHFLNS